MSAQPRHRVSAVLALLAGLVAGCGGRASSASESEAASDIDSAADPTNAANSADAATTGLDAGTPSDKAPGPDSRPDEAGIPIGLPAAAALGAGYYSWCMIQPSLSLKCSGGWSCDMNCATGEPPNISAQSLCNTTTKQCIGRGSPPDGLKAVQIVSAHVHDCVINAPGYPPPKQTARSRTSGPVTCYGSPSEWEQMRVPGGLNPVKLAAGDVSTCALNRDSSVRCWGVSVYDKWTNPPAGLRAKDIAVSGVMACAIKKDDQKPELDDTLTCWGLRPAPLPGELETVKVSRVALASNGGTHLWWWDATNNVPDQKALAEVFRHGCLIRKEDKSVACWGDDSQREVSGVPPDLRGPNPPVGAKELALGEHFSCALQVDGKVRCWGAPGNLLPANFRAKAIAGSLLEVCAISADDDTVTCTGRHKSATGTRVFVPPGL